MNGSSGSLSNADEAGAAAVEFALVLIPLILLVFGMIFFGLAFNAKISLSSATREGARVYALGGTESEVKDRVTDSAGFISVDPARITLTGTIPCTPGQDVRVTAEYDLAEIIPLWDSGSGTGTMTVTGIGVMRCGG